MEAPERQFASAVSTLILVVSLLTVVQLGAAAPGTYGVTQGGTCYEVTPLGDGSSTVEGFYDYRSAGNGYSSHGTGQYQANQVSSLLFYHGSRGDSLVVLHDEYRNAPYGSTVTFDVSGLPSDGEWAVEDDDYPGRDDNWVHSGSSSHIEWMWAENRNDGGAFRGLQSDRYSAIRIVPGFNEDADNWGIWSWSGDSDNRIRSWRLHTGSGWVSLDMDQPITIEQGGCGTETPTPSPEPTETPTPEPTETPTPEPTPTSTPEPTPEPTETPTPEPTETPEPTPTTELPTTEPEPEQPPAPSIEWVNCSAVRIEGDAPAVEIGTSYYLSDGIASDILEYSELTGTTILHPASDYEEDSVEGEFVITGVTVFSEDLGEVIADADNPNVETCDGRIRPEMVDVRFVGAEQVSDGTYETTLGYTNPNEDALHFDNRIEAGTVDEQFPVETFAPGTHRVTVTWTPANDDERLSWRVSGGGFGLPTVTAESGPASEYGEEQTTEQPTEEPTEETPEEPAEDPTQEPTEESTEQPTERPTERPAEEPTTESPTAPSNGGGTGSGGANSESGSVDSYPSSSGGGSSEGSTTPPAPSVEYLDRSGSGLRVLVENARASEPVAIEAVDLAANGVTFESVSFSTTTGDYTLDLTTGADAPTDVDAPAERNGLAPLGYLVVGSNLGEADVANATVRFTVDRALLDGRNITVDQVALFRATDGEWVEVETRLVDERDEVYEFETALSGFSTSAVGAKQPVIGVRSVLLSSQRVETGESFDVTATIENTGAAAGTYTANLTMFDEIIDARQVEVPAGESVEVTFTRSVNAPGTYTVRMDDASAELTVEAGSTEMPASTTTENRRGQPGFGPLAALLALAAAGLLASRRR